MKKIVILLVSVIFLLNSDLFAQLRPAQSQYLKQMGALVNPSFEQGYKGWEITGTCTQSLESDIPYLNKTLKLTCVNQQFSVKQNTTELTGFVDQQALLTAQVKANIGGVFIRTLNNDVEASSASIIAGDYKAINIPDKIASTSNGVEIHTNGVDVTGEFFIDEVGYRLAPDLIQQVGQAQFVGKAYFADNDCDWTTSSTSFTKPTTAGDCQPSEVIGNISFASPVSTPTVIINNFRTDGYYKFEFMGLQYDDSTTSVCRSTVSKTSTLANNGIAYMRGSANIRGNNFLRGDVRFESGDTGEINILLEMESGSACSVRGEVNQNSSMSVYFYPDSNSTIVSQKQQSPNKAGFITWSIFDSEIEGHLKADGSCVDKTVYSDFFRNVGNLYGDCDAGGGANTGVNLPNLTDQNRFIRASGGSLAVGTLQAQSIQSHAHTISVENFSENQNHDTNTRVAAGANAGTTANRATSTVGGSETRPINIAFVPFVKMFDSDIIIGKFEAIEQVTADLTFETVNELSAQVLSGGNTFTQNYNWIDSCSRTSTGIYVCNLVSNFPATQEMACVATTTPNVRITKAEHRQTDTPQTLRVTITNESGSLSNQAFNVICSKQGADVNKSFTGAVINASKNPRSAREDQYSESEIPWGKWNGEQLYRRCFTVDSDITSTSTIVTWDTGLKPVNKIKVNANDYIIQSRTSAGTSTNAAEIFYESDTGNLNCVVSGTGCYTDTSFCMDYTK